MMAGSYGSSSIVGVGRRPLLQKVATVTVAISLTIATADTFSVAEDQYNQGYLDSSVLVDNVVGSLEIRIVRVISDTFLWLAQVQTLIRLFPRHKEKVTIKWLGFAMVSSDTIFSILDSFVSGGNPRTRPRTFQDAIPALNYLFELAISLIYASCVVYYCLSKRRFAFWHPKMKNICLVALLSLVSVVIPVVFFILDISQPDLAGWGEYIRWVGAAAASVVVWEWVERIESLERDERKDGILGREVFDGDEMLDMTPSEDASMHRGDSKDNHHPGGGPKEFAGGVISHYNRLRMRLPLRKRRKRAPLDGISTGADALNTTRQTATDSQLAMPQHLITPPSRSDTGSAASTVYAIRYHNLTSPSPNLQQEVAGPTGGPTGPVDASKLTSDSDSSPSAADKELGPEPADRVGGDALGRSIWQSVANPFKRRKAEPPAEVADAQIASGIRRSPIDRTLNLRDRLGAFASAQRDRFASRGPVTSTLPVTIIPAPKNNDRTWSPDDIRDGSVAAGVDAQPLGAPSSRQPGSYDPNQVMVIPAPVHGRTWSPDEAQIGAANPAPAGPNSNVPRHTSLAPGDLSPPQTVYIPRGSLTISESDLRPSRVYEATYGASPRSTTYAPPPAIAPIAENLADVIGHESHSLQNSPSRAHQTQEAMNARDRSNDAEATTSSHVKLPSATQSPEVQNQPPSTAVESSSETDGRDTGGTES